MKAAASPCSRAEQGPAMGCLGEGGGGRRRRREAGRPAWGGRREEAAAPYGMAHC